MFQAVGTAAGKSLRQGLPACPRNSREVGGTGPEGAVWSEDPGGDSLQITAGSSGRGA